MTAAAPLAQTLRFGPFDGGLNLRDAYTEIAPNELADGTNFTLDERGVAVKRNDCPTTPNLGAASTPPGAVTAFFYSQVLGLYILQSGAQVYKAAPGAGAWTSFHTFTTAAVCLFVDFTGKLIVAHPVDGVFSYDGTTFSAQLVGLGAGALAVWQNKVWLAGATSNTIWWSKAGDVTTWTTGTDFVSVRDKDDKPITALFGGSGLIVFKEDSVYRINDSTTGAYQTIDWHAGCVGPLAVCATEQGIFHWGLDALYRSNGLSPSVNVGDKVRTRFFSSTVNATTKPMVTAVVLFGRVYFTFPRTSSTIADAILEYNPRVGWFMEAYFGGARVGPFIKYPGLDYVSFASGSATIKDLYNGLTRTGFTCSLTTAYVEPFAGKLARVLRLRPELNPPASSSLGVGLNYTDAAGALQVASMTASFTSAGTQRPNLWPAAAGRAFAVALNDISVPLNSLSVLQASIDAVQLER